ncbi:MAG: hypothetical protein IKU18_06480, partial [Bacteroidales bacterium]|nr:hypothetical protein [Bacteroidales bacterium]
MANISVETLKENIREISREYDAICILGPTASGKTRFAIELAVALSSVEDGVFVPGAEIISADSRQVYRGMDIGTGKDLDEYKVQVKVKSEAAGQAASNSGVVCGEIPYHLTDIVEAGEKYNIFQYQRDVAKAYASIKERGLVPLICGGSG